MTKSNAYSTTQIVLHWLIVVLVLVQFLFHGSIEALWQARMASTVPNVPSPDIHAGIGILIFLLMGWRIWLRLRIGVPAPPADKSRVSRILSQSVQGLLYLCLILMPLSGATAWFFGLEPPAVAHVVLKNLVLLLVLLHIAGALVQHFVVKSNVLMRMLGRA